MCPLCKCTAGAFTQRSLWVVSSGGLCPAPAGALPPSPAGRCPAPAGALPPSPLLFNVKSSKSKSRSAELEKSLHSSLKYLFDKLKAQSISCIALCFFIYIIVNRYFLFIFYLRNLLRRRIIVAKAASTTASTIATHVYGRGRSVFIP